MAEPTAPAPSGRTPSETTIMASSANTSAGPSHLAPAQPQLPGTQLKRSSPAIPVDLNEAALDSPSFRAMTAHFVEQIDGVERWLDYQMRTTSKLVSDVLVLEETIKIYSSRYMPPAPAVEFLLDPDYTMLALRRASDSSRQWWTQVVSAARIMDAVSVEPIRAFISGELRNFKDVRRILEQTQKTYDSVLARYLGQSKTKEPSSLREDAFAVYETRKAYLQASISFCQMASQLRFGLDKLLVRVCTDIHLEVKRSVDGTSAVTSRWGEEMQRVRGWSREMEASEFTFKRELQLACREISEATISSYKPSRELDDYTASTVPFLGSRGPTSVQRKGRASPHSPEKQGWLSLRVQHGKPVRTNWIRRWYYCRDGVFGWLAQGPSGVLQGEEVGVLLCSVKPAVQEERRFCFEVKTKSRTLLLQAETQGQLMEWLEAYEVSKTEAMYASMGRDHALLPGGVDPAFAVTAPVLPEFSAKVLESSGDDNAGGTDKPANLPVPAQDGGLASRVSMDAAIMTPPRRSITMLGREDGESGREHATRIMQKLDLHRKATLAAGNEAAAAAAAAPPQTGTGIASLISASHTAIPAYSSSSSSAPAPRQQPAPIFTSLERRPGSLAPMTLANPPISTSLSRPAVLATGEWGPATGGPHQVSAAVAANYLGSGPWNTTFTARSEARKPSVVEMSDPSLRSGISPPPEAKQDPKLLPLPGHRKTFSEDSSLTPSGRLPHEAVVETFPAQYPAELKAQHAQFRLLFPTVPPHEKLVLVFNAAWSSASEDPKQSRALAGTGRVFVTADNMYFYGHQVGLLVLYAISLDMITEVAAAPGRDCDHIYLHLNQDVDDIGLSRITLKLFLEDLGLMHARLNLLVDDLQAEEPMELAELVSALANLEKEEYDRKSPGAESWEEVPSNTPIDDGTSSGRPAARRGGAAGLGIRHSTSKAASQQQNGKLRLPAHAVVYEPEDMGECVVERHFEISAKACFHVLFGDKSFIFPKIYFERRAKEIAQGPWELEDHGKMRRQFRFKVDHVDMLGRSRPGAVVDHQTVDLFSDHVTYVVTHVKTAWHLPHSQAFRLITKVVITHVAKSKCKLAIYTKVDWSKAPAFAKNMVQRQAMGDAAKDAEELAEITTDQVRKLGPHSRTKRAIQVYGNIGQQKQVVLFTPSESEAVKKALIRPRTLTEMLFETARSFMESAISSIMMWAFAGCKRLFGIVTAQRIILSLLAVSSLYNLVVTSQGASAWWAERSAAGYMSRIGIGPNAVMSKAIYLTDLEEASRGASVSLWAPQDSACYDTFRHLMNSTDMDAPYERQGAPASRPWSTASEASARRLRRVKQRFGTYRHDLVVAMRVINSVEREFVNSEWETWLAEENERCEQARAAIEGGGPQQKKQQRQLDPGRREALRGWHREYCGSCVADQKALAARRESLV